MPADTLEAPPFTAPDLTNYSPDQAQGIFNPESVPPKQNGSSPSVEKPAETQVDDRPEAMKPKEEKTEPKDKLGKLGAIKKPEEPKIEEPKVEAKTEKDPLDDAPGPKQLRDAYNKLKEEHAPLKENFEKTKAEYESIRKEFDLTKEEMAKLKAMNLNENERKEYVLYRQLNAERALIESDDYKKNILGPIQSQFSRLQKLSKEAKLDPNQLTALQNAVDMPDEIDRNRAIRTVLKSADIDPEDFGDFLTVATDAAKQLKEVHYPKMESKLAEAREIEQAARTKEKEQTVQASTKGKEEYTREYSDVHKTLTENQFKALMDDTDLNIEGTTFADAIKTAEPGETARDKAYQAMAGAAMPFMIEFTNKLWARVDAAERAIKASNGVKPKAADGQVKAVDTKSEQLDANAVFRAAPSFGG